MRINADRYRVKRTDGETEYPEEFTYIPGHERDEIKALFTGSTLFTILDEVETALLEGGSSAAFEKIEDLDEQIRGIVGVEKKDAEVEE